MHCPNCRHENPPGSKFCNNCGNRLEEAANPIPAPPAGPLSNLASTEYTARLEQARAQQAMVGERRIVTMLFCDIAGSTSAAEQLDPEDWAEIVNQVFEIMIRPVLKYEGTVARLMGDAILAFFGAPIAHEDDPQRAILAGLEIVSGFQPLRRKIAERWQVDFDVRAGINTGLVMVGQVGSDMQMEYTALGDAINLAARMEQTAAPGTVQVSEATYRLAAPLFAWEPLDEIILKGKAEPVRTYRAIGIESKTVNLRGVQGLDAPLTGRQHEWEQLLAAADALLAGRGQAVFLVGEAGLGKSRLIREIKTALSGVPWYETAALSYETGQPYALFRRLLRRIWDLGKDGQNLENLQWLVEDEDQRQAAFSLLGGGEAGSGPELAGENLKRSVFGLVEEEVERLMAQGPVVLVFDDLHWSDPASSELLQRLLVHTENTPLLVLSALRADQDSPGWEVLESARSEQPDRLTEVHLAPLGDDETRRLLANMLPISRLPEQLQRQIMAKTDGNPFFIEEVVRTLIEDGVLVAEDVGGERHWRVIQKNGEIEIPESLQALLAARIDRLARHARQTLQLASVIGRTFFLRVLKAIHEASEPVEENLRSLMQAEMVLEAGQAPELEYMFRHALTQETAYGTLLRRERREYHLRVGEAMESLYAGRRDEMAPILAHHFREAGDSRALDYGVQAGDAAFRLYAVAEAAEHYRQVLELVENKMQLDSETFTHVHLRLGRCSELGSDYSAALAVYAGLEAAARKSEDQGMLLAALIARATALAIPTPNQDPEKARQTITEGLALAETLGDEPAAARLAWVSMVVELYSGNMLGGIPYGERAVEMARRLDLQELLAYALQDLGVGYISAGRLEEGDSVLNEAYALWAEMRNLPMLAESRSQLIYTNVAGGNYETALAYSQEANQISVSINNLWGQVTATIFLPLIHIARGEVDTLFALLEDIRRKSEAIGHPARVAERFYIAWMLEFLGAFDQALVVAREGHQKSALFPPFHPLSQSMLARQYIFAGNLAAAEPEIREAAIDGSRNTLPMSDLMVDMAVMEYEIAAGNFDAAQQLLDTLMGKLSFSGTVYYLAEAFMLKAGLQQARGDEGGRKAALEKALEAATRVQKRILLWRIHALLGDLEAARREAAYVLGQISDEDLRMTFRAYTGSFGVEI